MRLVDGSDDTNGRVEVFTQNSWRTVCDDGFDDEDAQVICKSLG